MGIQDFLFGEPDQPNQLDPRIQAARNFLLEEMMKQYAAGPVNVPTYQAVIPENMYSGTNDLLSSLGFSPVSVPSMPTTNIGGIEAYTSQPIQEAMQGQSSVGGGGAYGSFQGSGVAATGTGYGTGGGGGGGGAIPARERTVPGSALTASELAGYNQAIAGSVGMESPFDPTQTAQSQMTAPQYSNYSSQPMSSPGQQAADAIYMNNLATSGSGSLATGRSTGGNLFQTLLGGAQKVLNVPVLGDIAGMTVSGQLAQKAIDAYGPSSRKPFDPSDPSTFVTASGQNANQAFQKPSGGGLFGFTSFRDMFDGGGPGASRAPTTAAVAPKPVYTAPATSGAGVEKARQAAANARAAQLRSTANPAQVKAKLAQGMKLSSAEQAAVDKAKSTGLGWMYTRGG